MKIAVDARELIGRPTGVGRYLAEILACWSRLPEAAAHEVRLMAPEPLTLPAGLLGAGGARVTKQVVPPGGAGGGGAVSALWWEQRVLPAAASAAGARVIFCPGYSGPLLTHLPVVVSIHDVSFWANPAWFHRREGLRRRVTSWAVARRARLILTLTAFSRDEILRWLGPAPERVRVIAPGVGGFFDPVVRDAEEKKSPSALQPPSPPLEYEHERMQGEIGGSASDGAPIVLTVGSIFNRRHVDQLIRAFARIAPQLAGARLVIVGENRTHPHQDFGALAQTLGIADRVDLRSYVSDDELRALYRQARAFAFLSTYEGFGLTPLEAIVSGVPTVVYDTEVAREVHAGLAHLVPAGDLDALAGRLRAMLTEAPDLVQRAALARAARERYPWRRTATATLAALQEAAHDEAAR